MIAAAEDEDIEDGSATFRISATSVPNKDVTATEDDIDTMTFVASPDTLDVAEGETAQFQVRLSNKPSADVNVTIAHASGDTDISVQTGASLTFTSANWNVDQTVTLEAAQDDDIENGIATIRASATGIPDKDVTATELDDDTLNFTTDTNTLIVPEGSTAIFQLKLTAQPSADVNVTVTHIGGDSDITVQTGANLTFTTVNWDTYQDVTLAAAEDDDIENDTASIQISATGIANKDITAEEQDNDTLNFVTDSDNISVPEGSTATFNIRLTAQPSVDVNVSVTRLSGDTDITIDSGASLLFTSLTWNVDQIVTLAAAEDSNASNDSATIRIDATGIDPKDITATEADDDVNNGDIRVNLPSSQMTSGGFVVAFVDISNNLQTIAYVGMDLLFDDTVLEFVEVWVGD